MLPPFVALLIYLPNDVRCAISENAPKLSPLDAFIVTTLEYRVVFLQIDIPLDYLEHLATC